MAYMNGVVEAQPGSVVQSTGSNLAVSVNNVTGFRTGIPLSRPVTSSAAVTLVTGGTPPYTYAWTKTSDFVGNTSISNATISNPTFTSLPYNVDDGDPYVSLWNLTVTDNVSATAQANVNVYLEYVTTS